MGHPEAASVSHSPSPWQQPCPAPASAERSALTEGVAEGIRDRHAEPREFTCFAGQARVTVVPMNVTGRSTTTATARATSSPVAAA